MKTLKIFKVLYILNFVLYLLLFFELLYHFFSEKNHTPLKLLGFVGINAIIFILVIFFTKTCFNLVKAGENNLGLSFKKITKSNIISVLYNIYSCLLLVGAYAIINSYFRDWKYIKQDILLIVRGVFFILLTLISFSISILYWVLLKKIKHHFAKILNSLGSSNN